MWKMMMNILTHCIKKSRIYMKSIQTVWQGICLWPFTNGLRMCQQGNAKYKKHGKECRISTAMEVQGVEWH